MTVVARVAILALLVCLLQLYLGSSATAVFVVLFVLVVLQAILGPNRLLNVRIAQRCQQLTVALLLPHKRLILRLSELLLREGERVVVLALLVAFVGFSDGQGVDPLKAPVIRRLKGLLLFFELVDSLPAHHVFLFQGQLSQHPVLLFLVQALQLHLFLLDRKTKQAERVNKEASLDVVVKGRVSREAGRLVDLKQDRLALVVQNDVEAQNLEAHQAL